MPFPSDGDDNDGDDDVVLSQLFFGFSTVEAIPL